VVVPSPPPAATPAPLAQVLTLTTRVNAPRLSTLRSRGLTVRIGCSAACRATVIARVDRATARRLKLRSRELGRATSTGGNVRVRLNSAAKRALARARTLKLQLAITAFGPDGERAAATRTLTIRR
jgi:hypothetical protein